MRRSADPYRDVDVIDSRAPRTNQAVVGVVSALAVATGAWWLLALLAFPLAIGLGVGILVGMTGMGGGSLMTPMLILLFGFDAKTAVGTDILHGAVFKSFGAVRHRQLGNVHAPLALWMLVGSAPFSLLGVQIASSFGDGAQGAMSKLVGATLVVGGLGFLAKTFMNAPDVRGFDMARRDRVA